MKAILSQVAGDPGTLVLADVPEPEPGPNDVLVAVKACGINFPDGLLIRDKYQIRPPRPFAPGSEISGIVARVGAAVSRFRPGQHVIGRLGWGGLAERVAVPEDRCIAIDATMPFDQAAAFIFTYGTAHYALVDRGHVAPGETVLVLGASGGVGIAAVQAAKALGARVIAAASSTERLAVALANGAERGVVYPRTLTDKEAARALAAEFKDACGATGADVVLDPVGGPYAEPALRAIARNGRHLVVGFTAGIPAIPLNLPLLKSCSVVGVDWGAFVRGDPAGAAANAAAVLALYGAGKLSPRVSERFTLAEAPAAIARLESRAVTGKLVVMMD
ncbi:MAG: NADPH:quinone oxidoreductase family protein [Xanthobacteraceae bacterium]|nr:NADPH:quinone oxidoreductase family protein [Xanthobacteraceae bacterium]